MSPGLHISNKKKIVIKISKYFVMAIAVSGRSYVLAPISKAEIMITAITKNSNARLCRKCTKADFVAWIKANTLY